ncbi:MAG: YCF48-related protein [Ignavibacteria bacterium]
MKKIIIFLIIFIHHFSIHSQWLQQTSGTSNNLKSINFINANTGFCVGSGSTILKTTNGGANWVTLISPVQTNFDYVRMFSVSNVIIGSVSGNLIVRSYDGGTTMENFVINIPGNETKKKVQFVSFLNGFFLTGAKIYKTTDGGINWNPYSTNVGNRDMCFINENTGWLCNAYTIPYPPPSGTTYSEVRLTVNGGANWEVLVSIQEFSFSISRIFFIDNTNGFYNGFVSSSLARTNNGGYSWNAGAYGAGSYKNYYNTSFPNSNTGWFIGDQLIKTTNGGLNWNLMTTSFGSVFNGIHFIDTSTGWMVSNSGLIIKTTTGGLSGISIISSEIPSQFSLSQNYPNPFNPTTKIKFQIPPSLSIAQTFLSVYDALGREVTTLVNQQLKPGTYEASWDASNFPSGVYFYKLSSGDFVETKKMVIIK